MAKQPQQKTQSTSQPAKRKKKVSQAQTPAAPAETAPPLAAEVLEDPGPRFPIVGIGASAGGLDAFKQFFATMPANSGMAFVLVQHLDPTHVSFTAELLARQSAMPVVAVQDGVLVAPDHVYVIPPATYLTVRGQRLHLSEPIKQRGMRMPIDFFFRSLAIEQQQRAVAIILSGTGSDGTLGLREVKAAGGMVMVQDPEMAQFDGMPRSAIATGAVDHVLPVSKMAHALIGFVQHPYVYGTPAQPVPAESVKDGLQTIVALLRARVKYDFSGYKSGTLTRRVQRRMGLRQIEGMPAYVEYLRENRDEVMALYKDLLIGVTNFFRDPDAWRLLGEQVIVPLVRTHDPGTPVRVWVPGCATGEEAYSLAMLLSEKMQAAEKRLDIQIFASDIDQDALAFARTGIYPENIAADLSDERLKQFFTQGNQTYRIHKEIRESVVITQQNLISDPPFSKLDLVSCRNLLIYLEGDLQKRILALFHFVLNPNGFLFLGNSETTDGQPELFEPVSPKWRIYHRLGAASHGKLTFPLVQRGGECAAQTFLPPAGELAQLSAMAQHLMLDRYCPASVLINRKAEVFYLFGPTDDYLQLPAGEFAADLSAMARESLRTKLRAGVHQAIRENQLVVISDARVRRGKSYCPVHITIEPLRSPKEATGLLLVTFTDGDTGTAEGLRMIPLSTDVVLTDTQTDTDGTGHDTGDPGVILRQLEDELRHTREDLQATVEELATSNEEFKAAHEEVTSINEELQATNEELETSKEELQSLNEELTTVNSQLEQKLSELEAATNDLANLLASTDIAVIFLDRRFCIKRFTRATTRLLHLIPTDIGRPLSDIARRFTDANLLSDADQVLERLIPISCEVCDSEGRWYIRRILPYRTEDNRIDGVVLTFTDISARHAAEKEIEVARLYAEGIVNTVRNPLVVLDRDLRVQTCNPAFYAMFPMSPDDTEGQLIYTLGNRQWDIPALRTQLEEIVRQSPHKQTTSPVSRAIVDYEVEYCLENTGPRTMLVNVHAIGSGQEPGELILLAIEDITDRKRTDEELRQLNETLEQRVAERARSHARLASLVASTADAIIACDVDGNITDWNEGASRLFGHPEKEAIGQNFDALIPPNGPSEFRHAVERLLRGETVSGFEMVRQSKDGQPKNLALTVSLIRQPDAQVVGVSGIIRDVTDRQRLEQQLADLTEQERRRIGQELHDSLGQQISAVGVLATSLQQTLQEQIPPDLELVNHLVRGIEDAKVQVRLLTRGLLPVEVDAEGLMNSLRELTSRSEEVFGVACIFECPCPVHVDDNSTATHLYRIAQEAINNAGQHARAEQIIVTLREEHGLTLQVRDDGVGLPVEPLTTAGSGLRIMRYRAQLIGATFWLEKAEDGGTVVTCSIPGRGHDAQG